MIRALVVDDEELARARLRQMLGSFPEIDVVGEAVDGDDAVAKIADCAPDLVLLDIQMPGRTGLEVAAALPVPRPRVIFCTAFDQYAIDAFEVHAIDYLLKPVNRNRLSRAVERARKSILESRSRMRDLEGAREIQQRLMPRLFPPMAHLRYHGTSRPAQGVTGDYYDFLPLGSERLGIVLGDVCGKGVPAGLVAASLQGRLQSRAQMTGERVEDMIAEINRSMCAALDGTSYVTLFYALYEDFPRRLIYVNAGHNPPLLIRRASGPLSPGRALQGNTGNVFVSKLETGGTVIGLLTAAQYQRGIVDLNPDDVLVFYTDGISEAVNPSGEEFGEARLISTVIKDLSLEPDGMVRRIYEEVDRFAEDTPQRDDQTVVIAKVNR